MSPYRKPAPAPKEDPPEETPQERCRNCPYAPIGGCIKGCAFPEPRRWDDDRTAEHWAGAILWAVLFAPVAFILFLIAMGALR